MARIIATIAIGLVSALSLAAPVAAGGDHGGGGRGDGDGGHMGSGNGNGGGHEKNAPVEPGAREIAVVGKSFEFTPDEITVQAGEDVTIVLRSGDILHDFVVKGQGHVVVAKRKKTARGGLMIDEPGTYKFWCSVAGHRRAGMKGTIVVH